MVRRETHPRNTSSMKSNDRGDDRTGITIPDVNGWSETPLGGCYDSLSIRVIEDRQSSDEVEVMMEITLCVRRHILNHDNGTSRIDDITFKGVENVLLRGVRVITVNPV